MPKLFIDGGVGKPEQARDLAISGVGKPEQARDLAISGVDKAEQAHQWLHIVLGRRGSMV